MSAGPDVFRKEYWFLGACLCFGVGVSVLEFFFGFGSSEVEGLESERVGERFLLSQIPAELMDHSGLRAPINFR